MDYVRTDKETSGAVCVVMSDNGLPHRITRQPGDDISDLPAPARAEIEAFWTPELVEQWEEDHPEILPDITIPQPRSVAAEILTVAAGEVTGYRNGIGAAVRTGTGKFTLYFSKQFSSPSEYTQFVDSDLGPAKVTTRNMRYIKVETRVGVTLTDPAWLAVRVDGV